MTEQTEYWLHVKRDGEEVCYPELPPPPLHKQVLHIWIISDEVEETRTWNFKNPSGYVLRVVPAGEGWRSHNKSAPDFTVWGAIATAERYMKKVALFGNLEHDSLVGLISVAYHSSSLKSHTSSTRADGGGPRQARQQGPMSAAAGPLPSTADPLKPGT
jgi:hypothetical protein